MWGIKPQGAEEEPRQQLSNRSIVRELASQSIASGDALGWFESLYANANGQEAAIPWADMCVNPNLAQWLDRQGIQGNGRRAAVVGCGLGDDAEALSSLDFRVTALDISQSAIEWCRTRFPDSTVDYCVADLFSPPPSWNRAFNFVLAAYTMQVLPEDLRQPAMEKTAEFVASGGTMLVITRGRDNNDAPGKMPWPLMSSELGHFVKCGLVEVNFEDYVDDEDPPVRRFRVEYRRPEA